MNPTLEQLVMLQAVDLDVQRLDTLRRELPRRVTRAEADLRGAESARQAAARALAEEETLRADQQRRVDEQRSKAARLRRQMDGATSTAQVTALEHEINFAEAAIAALEDEQLASLERTDALEEQEREAAARIERASAALQTERARTERRLADADVELAACRSERASLRAAIDEGALSHYDRVTKSRGSGVAEGLDHKCTACQMMVRPQRWNDLTNGDEAAPLLHCETCGRMLFWDPRRDKPGAWAAGERLEKARALAAAQT